MHLFGTLSNCLTDPNYLLRLVSLEYALFALITVYR